MLLVFTFSHTTTCIGKMMVSPRITISVHSTTHCTTDSCGQSPSDLAMCFSKLSHAKLPKIGTVTTYHTSSTTPKLASCEAQRKTE